MRYILIYDVTDTVCFSNNLWSNISISVTFLFSIIPLFPLSCVRIIGTSKRTREAGFQISESMRRNFGDDKKRNFAAVYE